MHPRPYSVKFDDVWPELKTTIERIMHLKEITRQTWAESFGQVYSLCISYPKPYSDKLDKETRNYLKHHVESQYQEIVNSVDLLTMYDRCWKQYYEGIKYLHRLYKHFNSIYAQTEAKVLEIFQMGLELWKENMITALGEKLSWFLLEEMKNDRAQKCSNPVVLKAVVQSLIACERTKDDPTKLYREIFEDKFLSHTGEYYRIEVDKAIQNEDCPQYMEKVIQWMSEEQLRSNKFLHASSVQKVKSVCVKYMIADHICFLNAGFNNMFQQESVKDIQNLYHLLKTAESGMDLLASEIQAYITEVGCSSMNSVNDNNPEVFVRTFLQVRGKYLTLMEKCFASDKEFICALDKACITILKCAGNKKFAGKSPEVLANYCDQLLKKSSKRSEATLDEALSQAIIVFNYIEDKDIFQDLYGRRLANRLLFEKSESLYSEEAMISKLKLQCGHEFTKKYHDMFSDISLREEFTELFDGFTKALNVDLGCNVDVAVLRTSSWPFSKRSTSFAVPQELEKCIIAFEQFYRVKYSGRKLSWLHYLSTADMKLCYLNKPYVISITTYQMAVLLMFQKDDRFTFTEMKDNTKLENDILNKVIRSLTESKLLVAVDNNAADPLYELNMKYSNNKIKIKIPPAAKQDRKENSQKEAREVQTSTDEIRKMRLEPAIVRIMKARKTLKHRELIQEVITQVKDFIPKMSLIKRCIDHLIEKDYIERSSDCQDEYHYVA